MNSKIARQQVYINTYNGATHIYESPLGDCQTFSIAYIENLLGIDDSSGTELLKLLKHHYRLTSGKKQLLCNVRQSADYNFGNRLEKICESSGAIIFKNSYISTRNSQMTLYLIDVSKLVIEFEKKENLTKIDDIPF